MRRIYSDSVQFRRVKTAIEGSFMKSFVDFFLMLVLSAALAVVALGAADTLLERGEEAMAAGGCRIVVDAGHGGADGGAVGTDTGVVEAGLNLAYAKNLGAALEKHGMEVVYTRLTDAALAGTKKADMAARREALRDGNVDLVVSVHMNKFTDRAVSGPMAYYMAGSAEGQRLAQSVIDAVTDALGRPRRLANPGDYFVLRECACPAVLVECGFLSNPQDELALQDEAHQAVLCEAVAEGIMQYYSKSQGTAALTAGA